MCSCQRVSPVKMKLLPDTLLARAFLLIVVLIVLSLAASFATIRHAELEPQSRKLAQLVVSVVNLTRAAILSAAPEWRGALLAELADAEGLRVHLAEPDDVLQPLPERAQEMQMMVEMVRKKLGSDTRFALQRNGIKALWVSFFIGTDEFWVALPHERIEHRFSQVLLVGGGIVLLMALLGAYFIARQVLHPLKRLVLAAGQVGQGEVPLKLSEQGAMEVVAVSRAFNQMSADLASNERERALVLAGISHDLRTPLARIRLAAEMSADELLCEGLIADVAQMDAVIRQFLDYARLDEAETAVMADVQGLVRDVAQRFSSSATIRLELDTMPAISVRALLLGRALANLLDNAIKYGGGDITVRLYQQADQMVLAVMDRGVGIPVEQRESIKRPFVRLEDARSNASGSGLGLAIVERAARLHHGAFDLEGRIGGGLVAKLVLPIR